MFEHSTVVGGVGGSDDADEDTGMVIVGDNSHGGGSGRTARSRSQE